MGTAATKAIIYSAFSSAKGEDTIEGQAADCAAMAEREGWTVIGRYSDVGKSGFKGDRGQGLADAMAHAEREAPCVLVARDPERFARGDGMGADGARSFAEVAIWSRRAGVQLRAVRDDAMVSNPMLASLVSELANAESRRKAQRALSGAADLRKEGKRTGRTAYGYRPGPDGTTELDPEAAPVVLRIFERLAAGVSQAELARTLNTEREITGKPVREGGGNWAQGSLSAMVKNRAYLGQVPADAPSERADPRKPEAWKLGHPPIVTQDLWDAAHARIAERARTKGNGGGRHPRAGHALPRGLLRHICGRAMTPVTNVNAKGVITSARYICSGAKDGTCPNGGLRVDREAVDDAVLAFVASVAIDADESVSRAKAAADDAKAKHAQAIAHAEAEIAQATKGLAKALDDYMAEILCAANLAAVQSKWNAQLEAAQARLDDLGTVGPPTAQEVVSATVDALGIVRAAIDAGEPQRVVEAISRIFDHFVIGEDVTAPVIDWAAPADLAAVRAKIAKAEAESGRTVAQGNADALEDDGVPFDAPTGQERALTAAENEQDNALRAAGLIIVPMPRHDALASAMVDAHGRQVFDRVPLTTDGLGLTR